VKARKSVFDTKFNFRNLVKKKTEKMSDFPVYQLVSIIFIQNSNFDEKTVNRPFLIYRSIFQSITQFLWFPVFTIPQNLFF
jgi:hypothetical protein